MIVFLSKHRQRNRRQAINHVFAVRPPHQLIESRPWPIALMAAVKSVSQEIKKKKKWWIPHATRCRLLDCHPCLHRHPSIGFRKKKSKKLACNHPHENAERQAGEAFLTNSLCSSARTKNVLLSSPADCASDAQTISIALVCQLPAEWAEKLGNFSKTIERCLFRVIEYRWKSVAYATRRIPPKKLFSPMKKKSKPLLGKLLVKMAKTRCPQRRSLHRRLATEQCRALIVCCCVAGTMHPEAKGKRRVVGGP